MDFYHGHEKKKENQGSHPIWVPRAWRQICSIMYFTKVQQYEVKVWYHLYGMSVLRQIMAWLYETADGRNLRNDFLWMYIYKNYHLATCWSHYSDHVVTITWALHRDHWAASRFSSQQRLNSCGEKFYHLLHIVAFYDFLSSSTVFGQIILRKSCSVSARVI